MVVGDGFRIALSVSKEYFALAPTQAHLWSLNQNMKSSGRLGEIVRSARDFKTDLLKLMLTSGPGLEELYLNPAINFAGLEVVDQAFVYSMWHNFHFYSGNNTTSLPCGDGGCALLVKANIAAATGLTLSLVEFDVDKGTLDLENILTSTLIQPPLVELFAVAPRVAKVFITVIANAITGRGICKYPYFYLRKV